MTSPTFSIWKNKATDIAIAMEDCRRAADICALLAKQAKDGVEKSILVGIANQFNRLANRMSRRTTPETIRTELHELASRLPRRY
jgi:methyl coenzyme M reductase alpha subunit